MILHLPVSLLSGVSKCYLFSPTDPASSATWRVADEFVVWGSMSRDQLPTVLHFSFLFLLSNILIFHYVSLNPYPTIFTPEKTSLSSGERSGNRCSLTAMCFLSLFFLIFTTVSEPVH